MAAALLAVAGALVGAFAWARARGSPGSRQSPARPDQLDDMTAALLGRPRTQADPVLPPGATVREAAAALTATPEHRDAAARGDGGVMAGSPTAAAVLPPGTSSPDGVAIVGRSGRLFIARGANDFVRQHRGELRLSDEGLAAWGALLQHHSAAADSLGALLVALVVPDKLALHPEDYSEPLDPSAVRPIRQLLQALPGRLLYPVEELRRAAARERVSLLTDSHVTAYGAEVIHRAVLEAVGRGGGARMSPRPRQEYLMCGDLGVKFRPRVHEIAAAPAATDGLELVEDNAGAIMGLGGHLGVCRVTRCPAAPIDGRLVVFGDSYSYVEPTVAGNLGELLARTFRETHFLWAPFCWDPGYLDRHRPDVVLLQMAERFAITVPRREVSVEALAAETLRRKAGVVPEEITSPATA